MKKLNKTTLILALSTLVIGILIGWLTFGSTNTNAINEDDHSIVKDTETIWTCSMHPQIRKDEPGDCPICGMDLIPLESDQNEELDPMAVSMSATAMQLAQVQTLTVGKGSVTKSIQLNGKVQADERLLHTQSSHVSGRIEELAVTFTGDVVSKGQIIARLYSPELVTAQEELLEAQKIATTQPALFNAAKEKLKKWKLTEKQIDQVLTSGQAIESFPILADVSGYATEKMVNLGDYVRQGEPIYQIADLTKVWVLFDIYETDMGLINQGDEVKYTIQSIPGKAFNGTISYIDPVIDPKTRVAKARVERSNADLLLKPEMFASGIVEASSSTKKQSITVPKSAVMWTGTRSVVYLMQKSSQGVSFMMRVVTLGPELGDSYVIESGLEAGEEIAVHGTFSIDAAAQLAGKPSMMNPQGGVAMTGHNHGGTKNSPRENKPSAIKKTSLSTSAKKSIEPLFESYFSFKTALASDDFKKARQSSLALKSALANVDMNLFKGDAHAVWMELSSSLKNSLQHIEHQENIASLRESFIHISNGMIEIAESFEPNRSPIYIQHCPMADSNKGADWLSKEKEIRNPYFGESMLTCGEVTKEIK